MISCHHCGLPLSDISDSCLVLYRRGPNGELLHPAMVGQSGTACYVYEHGDCGDSDGWGGYTVDLPRLRKEGVQEWDSHIAGKTWYSPIYGVGLSQAYVVARALKPDEPPKREKRRIAAKNPKPPARLISTRTRAKIMERDGFKCRRCGCGPDVRQLEVDHIVPVAQGGDASDDNLQTLCFKCNAGKADREPHPHDLAVQTDA